MRALPTLSLPPGVVFVDLLAAMQAADVEQVVAVNDPATGLIGFIVLHDTGRGPGIGGCRFEDCVVVTKKGCEFLSSHPYHWEIA